MRKEIGEDYFTEEELERQQLAVPLGTIVVLLKDIKVSNDRFVTAVPTHEDFAPDVVGRVIPECTIGVVTSEFGSLVGVHFLQPIEIDLGVNTWECTPCIFADEEDELAPYGLDAKTVARIRSLLDLDEALIARPKN